ncbi:amino acid adenylation domain-containing protein [Streptomyces sp. NBC_01142]|uniref:non-ribosomal peptide synthetase n=1 Tax=Streptomyces sp. NBC_01142 TaxID=2975865 RepID=UPI002256316D|nr:non-ribosomal peptide synthetase [Streptomyces sp. NBC_01142]MCX4820788.1 amino acid adenylation domain-containing protein [Streptomyces sp. NBC_01142]
MFIDLPSVVRGHAGLRGSAQALTFAPTTLGTPRTDLTFGQVDDRSRAVAGVLQQRLGPGDRVLIIIPTAPEFVPAFLGCLAAGVIAVPLPLPVDESSTQRVLNVAKDCSATAVLSMSPVRQYLGDTPFMQQLDPSIAWIDVDLVDEGESSGWSQCGIAPEDVAFLQYTSGSTKAPRGVVVSHGSLMHNEAAIQKCFGVTPDSTSVSWLPLHHDMGLIGGLLQPLYTGSRAVILDPLSFLQRPASWLEAISEEKAQISGGPNFAYDLCVRKITEEEKARLDLSSWRLAFNGAAPVSPRSLRSFTETFGEVGFRSPTHTPCYGLAEVTLLVASAEATVDCESRSFSVESLEQGLALEEKAPDAGRELVSYRLLEHASVRVVDPGDRRPLAEGHIGEIWVDSDSNGSGYWGDSAGSLSAFGATVAGDESATYVRTGDLGFLHRGRLHVTGRMKDLVIHRGRNLHPEDLEVDVAASSPSLRPGCGAIFSVDGDGEEAMVVCQEVRTGTPQEQYPELVRGIREVLSRRYGVSARTIALVPAGAIIKTSSGKVQRYTARTKFLADTLPVLWSETSDAGPDGTVRMSDLISAHTFQEADGADRIDLLTRAIRAYLQQVLGADEPLDEWASPTSLGVDSLTAVQLQHEIENLLGVRLRPSLVLRAESIAELAETALEHTARPTSPAPGPGREDYELTETQRALWFLQRTSPDSYAYNVTRAFSLTGDVDIERLSAALNAVVRRHANLRLSLRTVDGSPTAHVEPEWDVRPEIVDARSWTEDQVQDWIADLATRPFVLEQDRLIRAAVVRREDCHLLVLSLHHIVCDLTSLAIILGQFKEAYGPAPVRDESEDPGLSPSALERAALADRGEELTAYWKEQLAGDLPVLELPSSTRSRGHAGATASFEGSRELLSALTRIARDEGLTLHNVLLASFQVLLHRVSGQSDVVVGVPVAGRTHQELASHVGYLVNVLPIRSGFGSGIGFGEFASTAHQRMLDALDHQDLPFPVMTQQINPDRTAGAPPIFQAMFSHYSAALPGGRSVAGAVLGDPSSVLDLDGVTLRGYAVPDPTAQSDISLNVAEFHDSLHFGLQFDTALVPRAQAEQFMVAYKALLSAVAADPQADVARLPLVDSDGVKDLIATGTGPRTPREEHYLATFERQVVRTPEALAVDDGTDRLSYAELNGRANHVAEQLREAGIGSEANVVMCAGRTADFLVALLGIHKAGACYVPISQTEAPRRVADMMATLGARGVIADGKGQALVDRALTERDDIDRPQVFAIDELCDGRTEQNPLCSTPMIGSAYIIHTSGSTGVPKAAIVTMGGMTNHLWQMIEHFGIESHDCIGQTAPATFDISVWQFLSPLMVGARLRIVDDSRVMSPAKLRDSIVESRMSLMEVVPVVVAALLEAGIQHESHALRAMISGGEALSWETARQWLSECPTVDLYNAYGPTECADDVSIYQVTEDSDQSRPVSIGKPLANMTVYILDNELGLVPKGMVGSLWVGGLGVGRGYLGNPGRTAEAFIPDPFGEPGARLYRTGDLARFTVDDDLEYMGRVDRQIKMRGLRIEPGEVEAMLRQVPGVADAVAKVHRTRQGMSLVAYLVMEGEGESRQLVAGEYEHIRLALTDRLPRHMIPTVFVRVGDLPRLSNGKINYGALDYEPVESSSEMSAELLSDPTVAAVRSIWSELLDHEALAWQDNFFLLGGHSLLALRMIDKVGQDLSVDLEIDAVFANPTLNEFVEAVRHAKPRSHAVTPISKISRVPVGGRRMHRSEP